MTKTAIRPPVDFQNMFQLLPNPYIAFYTDDPHFTIAAENDFHAKVGGVKAAEAVGKPLFDVFPDVSEKYLSTGVSDLAESIRSVIRTGRPDSMDAFRYDLQRTDGSIDTKYWRVTHHPVPDASGDVALVYQETADITGEVMAGRKLSRTEQQLAEVLSVGQIGIYSWDVIKDIVTGDGTMAELFGLDSDLVAQGLPIAKFTDAIHPDDRDRVEHDIAAALQTADSFYSEYRTVTKDGAARWLDARASIKRSSQGEPVLLRGALVDVTDRKAAEEALVRREREFQLLADNMPNIAWMAGPAGNVYWYNARWYQYTGLTEDDMVPGAGKAFHRADYADKVMKQWQKSLRSGSPFEMSFPLRNSEGTFHWFLTRVVPIRSDDGAISHWFGTNTDITDQKHAEDNVGLLAQAGTVLAASLDYKKNLQTLAKLIVTEPNLADWCGIEIFDDNHVLQQIAVAHKDPAKVAWAIELRRQQGPPDLSEPTGVAKVIRSGEPEFYPEITDEMLVATTKDKAQLKLLRELGLHSIIIVPIKMQDKIIGALSLISAEQKRLYTNSDLETAMALSGRIYLALTNAKLYLDVEAELQSRKKLQEELRTANAELEDRVETRTSELNDSNVSLTRSNRELQDFAYVASHDLQEPLRKIQAFGNLLQTEYADKLGDGGDYLERMRSAAARMSALIEDILSFSRVTTKGREFTSVNLQTVVQEVMGDLEVRIGETKADVQFANLPTIHADAMQMRQLLQNLISNAIKFHRPDVAPVIKITATADTMPGGKIKYCRLEISDNGLGFDEKYLDRIFAVFQRLHNRDQYEGTGIGLAVCRKIVERHGGTITATSKSGKGSTFIIMLPMRHKKGENLV